MSGRKLHEAGGPLQGRGRIFACRGGRTGDAGTVSKAGRRFPPGKRTAGSAAAKSTWSAGHSSRVACSLDAGRGGRALTGSSEFGLRAVSGPASELPNRSCRNRSPCRPAVRAAPAGAQFGVPFATLLWRRSSGHRTLTSAMIR